MTPIQYAVTREKATERPFTGEYETTTAPGTCRCIRCGETLFESDTKFDAGCAGRASTSCDRGHIARETDTSHGMIRTEVMCAKCDAHSGDVFPDVPRSSPRSTRTFLQSWNRPCTRFSMPRIKSLLARVEVDEAQKGSQLPSERRASSRTGRQAPEGPQRPELGPLLCRVRRADHSTGYCLATCPAAPVTVYPAALVPRRCPSSQTADPLKSSATATSYRLGKSVFCRARIR